MASVCSFFGNMFEKKIKSRKQASYHVQDTPFRGSIWEKFKFSFTIKDHEGNWIFKTDFSFLFDYMSVNFRD